MYIYVRACVYVLLCICLLSHPDQDTISSSACWNSKCDVNNSSPSTDVLGAGKVWNAGKAGGSGETQSISGFPCLTLYPAN